MQRDIVPIKKKKKKKKKKTTQTKNTRKKKTRTHAQNSKQLDRALNEYMPLEVQHLFASFRTIPAALISQTNNTAGTNMRCLTYGGNDYVGRRESHISEL